MKRSFNQAGGVTLNLLILAGLVLLLAILWQRATDKQQEELNNPTETVYVSPFGEFEITVPAGWAIGENSIEDEGLVILEVFGPRNDIINDAFEESAETESLTVEEALGNQRYNELLATSVGREYLLLQIEVVSSIGFDIPTDKTIWKDDLTSAENTATGIAYGIFEDFSVPGAVGYKYPITIFESEQTISATSYYLLGELAEAEILMYPADSNFAEQAEEVIKSMIFTTDEEAFEAAEI